MDPTASDPLPLSRDIQSLSLGDDSSPHFPFLDERISMYLKQILQKMEPSVLTTVREFSSTLDNLLMAHAVKRKFFGRAKFEESMRPDLVRYRGFNRLLSQMRNMEIRMRFYPDKVQIVRCALSLSCTSRLFHKSHTDCSCISKSYEFWKSHITSISAATAMHHVAGYRIPKTIAYNVSDADGLIDIVKPYKITIHTLFVENCSPTAISQMLDHFQSENLGIYSEDSQDYQKSVEITIDHIRIGKMFGIALFSKTEYPERIVEHFVRHFNEGQTLRNLFLEFPPDKFPQDRSAVLVGTSVCTLKRQYTKLEDDIENEWSELVRTDSSPPLHFLVVGGIYTKVPLVYNVFYQYVAGIDDLLTKMFNPSCEPHLSYPSVSDYPQAELREMDLF